MFEKILELFKNPNTYETPLPAADAGHVIGALLVRAAKADRAYLFQEVEVIDRVLAERHKLGPIEAAKMRAACEKLEETMPDTAELAGILQKAVGVDELENALRALWGVVFADGVEHEHEEAVLHEVEALFGVAPERAKQLHDEVMKNRMKI